MVPAVNLVCDVVFMKDAMKVLLGILLKVFVIAFMLLVIYWIILKLTGHSPTFEYLITGLILLHISITFTLFYKLAYKLGKIDATLEHHGEKFSVIEKELAEIKISVAKK